MKLQNLFAVVVTATLGLAATAQADLIGFYPFDADYDDTSGLGNDGTASGDTTLAPFVGVDGAGGGAAQFSGMGHVVVPIDSNPSVYPDMTVTMWVKADASAVGAPGLYKTFGHDDGGWDRTFGLDNRQDGGVFRWAAFTGGNRPGPTPPTATPVSDDWTFLAAVWDTDSPAAGFNSVTFYTGVDGSPNASTGAVPLNNTPSAHTTSAIGNLRPDNFNEGWQGLIDNVTIHDAALSAADIDMWKASTGPISMPTITWDNPNNSTTVYDLIGLDLSASPVVPIVFDPAPYPGSTSGDGGFLTNDGGDAGDANLNTIYNSHGWNAAGATITVDGLTEGDMYQIQLLAAGDTRGCCGDRNQAADDGAGNVSGDMPRNGPSSVVGSFTAAGATQDISIVAGTVNGVDPGLSGYILTDGDGNFIKAVNYVEGGVPISVPEPDSALLLLVGIAMICRFRKR